MADGKTAVLAENTAGGGGLPGEHGLPVGIKRDGRRVLFDTGLEALNREVLEETQEMTRENNRFGVGLRRAIPTAVCFIVAVTVHVLTLLNPSQTVREIVDHASVRRMR